jgi:hypothetical protein
LVTQEASPVNSLTRISSLALPRSSEANLINMNCSASTMRSMAANLTYKRFEAYQRGTDHLGNKGAPRSSCCQIGVPTNANGAIFNGSPIKSGSGGLIAFSAVLAQRRPSGDCPASTWPLHKAGHRKLFVRRMGALGVRPAATRVRKFPGAVMRGDPGTLLVIFRDAPIAFCRKSTSVIRRHNRKALDRSKASDRSPCRKALAHNLDRSAGAVISISYFRTRDTHLAGVLCRPERRLRGTDR